MIERRHRRAAFLAAAALSSTACSFQPGAPELHYSLNRAEVEKNQQLADDPIAQTKLEGALQMMFGTPKDPGFLVLPEWSGDKFDPNYWGEDHVHADAAAWSALVESNRAHFRTQLEAIRAGRFDAVDRPRFADDLWARWEGLKQQIPIDPDGLVDGQSWRSRASASLIDMAGFLKGLQRGTAKRDLLSDQLIIIGPGNERRPAPDSPDWRRFVALVPVLPDEPLLTTDDGQKVTWREEAIYRFENYYPTLANSAAFYRNQCYHCHGTDGGGNGTTGPWLNPHPRDYRRGIFKFTALKGKARPRPEDLFRTLAEGIYTTAMPSFRRFSDAQLHGLADYVRLLAIRGETEILLESFYDPDKGFDFDVLKENYSDVVGRWREASEHYIAFEGKIPEMTAERIAHGRSLFSTPGEKGGANCVSCHGPAGRGDGPSVWAPGKEGVEYAKDDWGNQIQPRDLTRGVFRFGRRPIDLYRRIYAGINGTPMPEHFGMTITEDGKQRTMNESDIWDLVFFVRSLGSQTEVASAGGAGHEGGAR